MIRRPPRSTLFPYTTLFRSLMPGRPELFDAYHEHRLTPALGDGPSIHAWIARGGRGGAFPDRKSTRLNSSHDQISYAVFCLKKKTIHASELDGHRQAILIES